MNYRTTVLFCCVFSSIINQAAYADKEDKSDEAVDEQAVDKVLDSNTTLDEGPLDSHEAMNNRELKRKLTKVGGGRGREKRSYEFLMGLVNNNSTFRVTNNEEDTGKMLNVKVPSGDLGASEMLLEVMVRIAAHPDQWEQVHNLLRKIDADLLTSKRIMEKLSENSIEGEIETTENYTNSLNNAKDKKYEHQAKDEQYATTLNKTFEVQKLRTKMEKANNLTRSAVKINNWPFETLTNEQALTTKYPWQMQTKSFNKNSYPRNFAYHRVTGNPLYHSNVNNNPKAYIAVSVIAPKPMDTRAPDDDIILENELRELKPWTHNQNHKNIASIRSRWVIRSDGEDSKPSYAP